MPVVHATMHFAGGRIKGLVPAVDSDEPQRKAESGTGNGEPGKSAYQSWLDLSNVGSEADFIESLRGPAGNDGSAGLSFYQRRVQTVTNATGRSTTRSG